VATTPTDRAEAIAQYASIGGAAVLAAVLFGVRFCGGVTMPPKPPPPRVDTVNARDVLTSAADTPLAYKGYIEADARDAGLPVPSVDAMGRRLRPGLDEHQVGLAPGDPAKDIAGLRLRAIVQSTDHGDDLVLVIENRGDIDLAYDIVTAPSYGTSACSQRTIVPFNALVVGAHSEERRSECVYRNGMVLGVSRVETLELNPLEAYYLSRVPPQDVGVDLRLAQGHRPTVPGSKMCNLMMSQSIRAGLENGRLQWRDLVDFYARHRCETYRFPEGYRAFETDGERTLPVVPGGG
jgi:hypothetical protein